jgi:hypothetical protein
MTIVNVQKVTATGVFDGNEWLNYSKFGEKPQIEAGRSYEMAFKEFKGKKYIQSAVAVQNKGNTGVVPPLPATASTAGLTPDRRDKRILVQGILQAALQSPGLVGFATSADEYLTAVESHTTRLVSFVEKVVGA